MTLPIRAASIQQQLHDMGIDREVIRFAEGTHTAKAAAAALGIEVGAIANSLIFWMADAPLLVMTSGRHRVDTDALAEQLGEGPIERATPEQVRAATGQVIGGVAPLGAAGVLVVAILSFFPTLDRVGRWLTEQLRLVENGRG